MRRRTTLVILCWLTAVPLSQRSTAAETVTLSDQLTPLFSCLSGSDTNFMISADITVEIDGSPQSIQATLSRHDDQQFDLSLSHPDYAVQIHRDADTTAMALPKHKTVYVGSGDVEVDDNLAPLHITKRLISSASSVSTYVPTILGDNKDAITMMAKNLLGLKFDAENQTWMGKDGFSVRFREMGSVVEIRSGSTAVIMRIDETAGPIKTDRRENDWADWKRVDLTRRELERQLSRGVRRTCEILAPSRLLTSPAQRTKKVANGELRWIEGQRVALLSGTPEQVGRAHGEILKTEANRCIDSVLYAFGSIQTIRTGRWFPHDLDAAYERLAEHIPEDHRRETRALAAALDLDARVVETINVFPELFHCSGFAVFGQATTDGKLYHGRVLDYMTTIGLQDSATTFVIAIDGKIPFANVGYAGFIGSVTGMNAKSISLGEMGGGGEGEWDGVPMATLMRRALEECSTLAEVKQLWRSSPRTCEYFYVFADGKTNEAVGVAALPDTIEFIEPGQFHERLGDGIRDAVVLSAGDRLKTLRQRVTSRFGQIDADVAMWLMSRPVAMESNLHNALFVPQDGIFYVANATHDRPAAESKYVRYDLKKLVDSMRQSPPVANLSR